MGFLYIIKSKALTKIGITTDVQRRMRELKPDKICQVVKLPREREKELEKRLHRLFADKRLQGSEYFFLNWAERRKACHLARKAGRRILYPHQVPNQGWAHWLGPGVALEICGVCLAIGVAAVLITRPQPNTQPQKVSMSFTAPGKVWFSYERQPQLV